MYKVSNRNGVYVNIFKSQIASLYMDVSQTLRPPVN